MGQILLGTQGWNYDAWVGSFYPKTTRPANYLSVYARAFRTVEVDSTFYGTPTDRTVEGWATRTPEGFVFSLKLPQKITHERQLEGVGPALHDFAARARVLGSRLGAILVQLGPGFTPARRNALERFLPLLPGDLRFAIEFRQREWICPALLDLLAAHRVALALTDARWIPRETALALAESPTADHAYVRWMGPDRKIEDFSHVLVDRTREIAEWAARLAVLASRVSMVYGYFNNHFQGHSPASARALQTMLGQQPVEPNLLAEQSELF